MEKLNSNTTVRKSFFLLFFVVIFFSFSKPVNGQSICFNIDSLKVYYVPWSLNTPISWGDYEVKHAPINVLSTIVIKDTTVLNKFTSCELNLSKKANSVKSIDVRMVIDVYSGGEIFPISLDKDLYFNFMGSIYQRNRKFINWIDIYVSRVPD